MAVILEWRSEKIQRTKFVNEKYSQNEKSKATMNSNTKYYNNNNLTLLANRTYNQSDFQYE